MELWIHVDLKRLAPTPRALMRHISGWAAEGATGIVFEWENMFPYTGFNSIVREDAYKPGEVTGILDHCRALGLCSVPLVQTLGHLKWFLSHPDYADLREFEDYPDEIRACCEKSYSVLSSWITDLLKAHHDSPYIHLGGDEARRLKDIDRSDCSSRKEGASAVFLRHMAPLFDQVVAAGKRPIVWADMVLAHPECLHEFPREVVFCDWLYTPVSEYAPTTLLWGVGRIDGAEYDKVPEDKKKYFEKYWRYGADDFPASFYQFPYMPFLRDHGFDVIGAPATLYATHSLAGPRLAEVRANGSCWLKAVGRFGGLGALNTCWTIRGALRETTLAGHRAFLVQGKYAPSLREDSVVATEAWKPSAGDAAEQISSIVDALAPPRDKISQTAPSAFDISVKTLRPVPYDERWPGLREELADVPDDSPLVLERMDARERAIRAEAALKSLKTDHEEVLAWQLGAVETGIRADIWIAARERALGRSVSNIEPLRVRIRKQAAAVADFMKDRYLPAELGIVGEDRYEGLLRLLNRISRPD